MEETKAEKGLVKKEVMAVAILCVWSVCGGVLFGAVPGFGGVRDGVCVY